MQLHSSRPGSRLIAGASLAIAALILSGCAASSSAEPESDAAPAVVARPPAPPGQLPARVQTQLQAALEGVMAEHGVPGAAAGVWIPGLGSWTTASGLADIAGGVAASTELSWPIRSITKSYTVTLLLQLADEGVLSVHDTVDQYLDGVTNGDSITLLQLANMSSGVAEYVNASFIETFFADPLRVFSLGELNEGVLGAPAQFEPGTQHVYTNSNTNLLGAVIERVAGLPYAEVLTERILGPLEQTGTAYITDVAEWTAPHPIGYQPDPETGEPIPQEQNLSIFGPAGSMVSDLEDGRVWAQMLGSGALLRPATQALREVGHPIERPPYDSYAVGIGRTAGWLGHNGEGIGFTSATFHEPATGASIVVYMNKSNLPDGSHPADEAFRALAALVPGAGG